MPETSTSTSTPTASTVKAKATSPRKAKNAAAGPPAAAGQSPSVPHSTPASTRRAATLLKQAADATRLRVIRMLADGERHVTGICTEMGISQPAVSHHIALLRASGIIDPRREGKHNYYSLTPKGRILADAVDRVMTEDEKGL